MTITIDTEKVFKKIQHPIDKIHGNTRQSERKAIRIKLTYCKPIANNRLNGENSN